MMYPHRLTLWVPSPNTPGVQDKTTGRLTVPPGSRTILYDGEADVQELTRRTTRQESGEPNLTADCTVYLADEWPLQNRNGAANIVTTPDGDVLTLDGTTMTIQATGEPIRIDRGVNATITWEDGSVAAATVVGIRRLDGVVLLRRAR